MTMKFAMGPLVATPGALAALQKIDGSDAKLIALIRRHATGDWGDLDAEDKRANDRAVKFGTRIFSAYVIDGVKFWIITEADRSSTTVLLPDEY